MNKKAGFLDERMHKLLTREAKSIADQWAATQATWHADIPERHHGSVYARQVVDIDGMVQKILGTDDLLFSIDHADLKNPKVARSPLGDELISWVLFDFMDIRMHFLKYRFSPRFQLFEEHVVGLKNVVPYHHYNPASVGFLNDWVADFRSRGRNKEFLRIVDNHDRHARANVQGLREGIQGLCRRKPGLLSVRMFLGKTLSSEWPTSSTDRGAIMDFHRPAQNAQNDLVQFLKSLSKEFPSLVWYAWRLEHAQEKSFYHQFIFLFHRPDHGDALKIGAAIGEIWKSILGPSQGVAIDCACHPEIYQGMTGYGYIANNDKKARAELVDACVYLAKVGTYAKLDVGLRKTYSSAQFKPMRKPAQPRGRLQDLTARQTITQLNLFSEPPKIRKKRTQPNPDV